MVVWCCCPHCRRCGVPVAPARCPRRHCPLVALIVDPTRRCPRRCRVDGGGGGRPAVPVVVVAAPAALVPLVSLPLLAMVVVAVAPVVVCWSVNNII
jgi:hypothetical protein